MLSASMEVIPSGPISGFIITLSSSDCRLRISLIDYFEEKTSLDSVIIKAILCNEYGIKALYCSRMFHGRLARMLRVMFRKKYFTDTHLLKPWELPLSFLSAPADPASVDFI